MICVAWLLTAILGAMGPADAAAQVRTRTVTVSPKKGTSTSDSVAGRPVTRPGTTVARRIGGRQDTTGLRVSPFAAAINEVVRLTNAERDKAGCPPLVVHDSLAAAAMAHSMDMAARRELGHTGVDGRSAPERARSAGYAFRMVAENVAAGQPDAAGVIRAWMESPIHRANILNCELLEIGVGAARSSDDPAREIYWTQLFGIPR